ncbi:hypothetical protein PLESTB_001959900 [Pleodorina starrii]|uniref:Importin N-terminal domain-containing protein n=1 Tax=Pleodorina starrii TaxID=330485 RepID=A0A9W6C267_9CHLO|nr:hypothetical protein PLESTM_002069000 [Pleodorina starrii]GLC62921.1 hypothetical protein PLESTB_001959900 [Pleodorina starrii]
MAASQLLAALNALYHHDDAKVKDEADRWLEQWQQSVEAWSVADGVLHDPSSSMEAQYFCAQTLRTKVQRDFEELPPDAVDSLRESLLQLLIRFSKGAPPVRTQLCLGLAALAVHVPSERWGDGGVVRWFALKFSPLPPDLALPCMLELLTVLPQEVHSYKIAVRPERRRAFSGELQANTGAAFEILTSCLSQPGERTRTQVLEAFGSWLKLNEGRPLPSIAAAAAAAAPGSGGEDAAAVLARHPLVAASLEGLQTTGETFHAAVDAICEVIWTTVDFNNPNNGEAGGGSPGGGGGGNGPPALAQAALPLVQVIVPAIMGLRGRFAVAARRREAETGRGSTGAGEGEFDDDEDSSKGMARLFCEVGEAYLVLIVSAVAEVRAPVEALLEVAAYPDFGICSMSFNFWHRLSRQLLSGSPGSGGSASGDDAAERERRRQFFLPAFERLVQLIRGRVREPESYGSWSKDEKHEFRSAREEVGDTLEDSAAVLGFGRCLSLLVEPLAALGLGDAATAAAGTAGGAGGGGRGYDWRTAEAALFCIKSIHRHATSPGDPSLQQLLEALPNLPRDSPQLQATVCSTMARYAKWLERSMQAGYCQPLLQRLLGLAVANLELPGGYCQAAAASAVRHLCEECGAFMGSCLQDLLGLYNKVLGMGAAARSPAGANGTAAGGGLLEEDVEAIIAAVCQAVSQAATPDQRPQAGGALLTPVLQQLRDALSALGPPQQQQQPVAPGALPPPPPPPVSSSHPHLNPLIDRLAEVFGRTADSEVVAQMLMASWPVLDALMVRCTGCAKTIEHVLRTLRYGIKGAGRSAAQLLPTLLEVLPARFTTTRHSAFLFIVSELVKFFGDDSANDSTLSLILTGLITEAGRPLTSLAALTSSPDMVDDLFLLGLRALGYAPRLLLAPPGPMQGGDCRALVTLLDVAMVGCVMQHREANGSVLGFIARLTAPATLARCPAAAGDVLRAHLLPRAPIFVRLLLSGIAGTLPLGRVAVVGAALMGLVAFGASPVVAAAAGAGGPGGGHQAGGDLGSSAGLGWLAAALQAVPDVAATSSDKQTFLGAATTALRAGPTAGSGSGEGDMMGNGDGGGGGGGYYDSGWEAACQEFADLCRRNKRARQAAQAALLPQELAAAVDVGERRRGG